MPTCDGEYIRNCCKDAVGWIFMVAVVIAFIILVILSAISPNRFASVENDELIDSILDSRCICICPHNLNITNHYNRTVFMRAISDPSKCTCQYTISDAKLVECLQCNCKFESRNALLIATIVYSTLVVSLCCMPPCALVVCIQPWVKGKLLRTYAGPRRQNQMDASASSRITRIRRTDDRVNETPT